MKDTKIPVYLYALGAMLFWGMSFVWSSILLKYYQPVSIIITRLVISSGFLFMIIFLFKKKEKIEKSDLGLLVMSALFNPFLYFLGENFGLKYSTSTITSVIIATIPVFSPVIAYISFREKLSALNITGIFISFGGILLMLINKKLSLEIHPKGILFLFGAVSSALFYSVFLRKLLIKYSPLTLITYQNLFGIIMFSPLFFIFEFRQFIAVTPNTPVILSFLCLSILASSISYIFYAKTIKVLGISKANIFTNLIPVFTAFFSYYILSENFTFQKIAGIAVVIAGVFISEWNKKKPASGND